MSPLYRQANTGINIFDPFRGSEAAFLWVETLRAFRTLFGTRRFIINGYQFGAGNSEAIASGAYWFYWRLGFRPSLPENVPLAEAEAVRLKRAPTQRTTATVLRRLARGDLVLDLADWEAGDAFEEPLLMRVGATVARRIAELPVASHVAGERRLAREVAVALGSRPGGHAKADRHGVERLAPLAAMLDLREWSEAERARSCAGCRPRARRSSRSSPGSARTSRAFSVNCVRWVAPRSGGHDGQRANGALPTRRRMHASAERCACAHSSTGSTT